MLFLLLFVVFIRLSLRSHVHTFELHVYLLFRPFLCIVPPLPDSPSPLPHGSTPAHIASSSLSPLPPSHSATLWCRAHTRTGHSARPLDVGVSRRRTPVPAVGAARAAGVALEKAAPDNNDSKSRRPSHSCSPSKNSKLNFCVDCLSPAIYLLFVVVVDSAFRVIVYTYEPPPRSLYISSQTLLLARTLTGATQTLALDIYFDILAAEFAVTGAKSELYDIVDF